MTRTGSVPGRPFGRLLSAMVTPFQADGSLDVAGAARLATHLVDEQEHDGLVINGTTGESATTSDAEKDQVLRAVVEAVGDRATVIAGVGTNDTAHTIELARAAEKAGADGLLVVTPYYNKPPQAGILQHFRTVADASGLPVMVYDIPGRSGVPIETETMCRLAEHERIIAVKDAKGDLGESAWVIKRTNLAYYSGEDKLTLPLLSVGAVGVVGVPTHVFGPDTKRMILAHEAGDVEQARELHLKLLPAYCGFFRTQGVMLTKAALTLLGLPAGPVRPPLVAANAAEVGRLREDCAEAGRTIGTADQMAHHNELGVAL
ncbi:4-hydroxy-tetrahydrodipicolinate synthase [Dactylosporangium sucinum]|uniref:4-hydroxy-tetrahydrodipicolinate synthase n=1 Tax=Dactylosporangium sucinum TaxID=1424081 RepID=A0A917U550_9ACTN|nr:4-hydroxy-tetrahydrodipicolinate synthase [Dactylosporangium sucinum]GGM58148.1 4-hydroxy-tetrahydrodipicolinate synthase 2 [Dactylosporangium sucinum]